jgi:hypothetical protein
MREFTSARLDIVEFWFIAADKGDATLTLTSHEFLAGGVSDDAY